MQLRHHGSGAPLPGAGGAGHRADVPSGSPHPARPVLPALAGPHPTSPAPRTAGLHLTPRPPLSPPPPLPRPTAPRLIAPRPALSRHRLPIPFPVHAHTQHFTQYDSMYGFLVCHDFSSRPVLHSSAFGKIASVHQTSSSPDSRTTSVADTFDRTTVALVSGLCTGDEQILPASFMPLSNKSQVTCRSCAHADVHRARLPGNLALRHLVLPEAACLRSSGALIVMHQESKSPTHLASWNSTANIG